MNKKISDLAAASALAGVEYFEVLQGGVNKKVLASQIGGGGLTSVDTTVATITLTFGAGVMSKSFYGSASFATPKSVVLATDTNANHFTLIFTITNIAATLTFESDFKSGDTRWAALVFTSLETGTFKATADYDGTNWIIEFTLFPAV